MNAFKRLQQGLNILDTYHPVSVEIVPIPTSFPNGAPDFSRSAYVAVEMDFTSEVNNAAVEKILSELGWQKEQEGSFWTFTT